ncbi:hypothetical protein [Morganella psychrotolerans]|uniref:Uncharacterized protein n=1 Tax=Morganella psychrotolerans TaxID=368603 RepID=A0A1B8HCS5_9GAMM|nr:hypothetical protein [Morganella psychrotolerans]OBU06870.1 hypothetical protein AYY18_19755 [Morganella psychrotolerans]
MKFEELPVDAQYVAALALADILKANAMAREGGADYAEYVKEAFVALYCQGSVSVQVGGVTVHTTTEASNSVDEVMKTFPPDQLSAFHIVKMVNAVNLTIRNELAPYDNDHNNTDQAARTILKTALAALDS